MSQQQGYQQGRYAGYPGYGQSPQTHMYQTNQAQYQHPQVVIPVPPRQDSANFHPSSYPQYPQYQPGYYQQPPTPQYQQPSPQQYYSSLPQQYHPQGGVPQTPSYQQPQYSSQGNYQRPQHQPVYQPPRNQSAPQVSPQLPYQQPPRLPRQSSSPQFTPQHLPPQNASPTLPHGPPTNVNPQVLVNQQRAPKHPHTPNTQPRKPSRPQILSSPDPLQQMSSPPRRVGHVEIPIQKPVRASMKSEAKPAQKRRRSNEGNAVAVCEVHVPTSRSSSQQHSRAPISSPLTELTSSQMPPAPTPQPKAESQPMLLALADEYVNAAYGMSSTIESDDQSEQYHELVSTAMGCLQALLDNYRQSDPRREARIRLRLASLMIDETENDEEAEEVLSKGVSLCERNRLVDLKYTMQHLSVRLMSKRNIKAALKATDNLVREVETLRLLHWQYVFRFLRVSFSLQSGTHADLNVALKNLYAITTLADERRSVQVQIVAATMEAIVHIRMEASDVVDLTQRSMAAARTHQLGPEMQLMPQVRGLLDCLDLTCALMQFNPSQVETKMQQMQNNLDKGTRDAGWSKDGSFVVDLCPTDNETLDEDTNGIMRNTGSRACMAMKWITSTQLYALGFLLSGLTKLHQNSSDTKTEEFLGEGLKLTKLRPSIRQSLAASEAHADQHQNLSIALRLYAVFARCGKADWQSARAAIRELRKQFSAAGMGVDEPTQRMLLYVEAMCRQGLGELKSALELYESPLLAPDLDTKANSAEKDIRTLATLHRVFILRTFESGKLVQADDLVKAVEPYCLGHSSKSFLAAFHLVKATVQNTSNTVIKTKQYLQSAVQASKVAANNLLLCVVMNLMTDHFFKNSIVGDQAEKAASVGRTLAKKSRNRLWTAVADGMYGEIMERCGKPTEADAARREAQSLYGDLPESLKQTL